MKFNFHFYYFLTLAILALATFGVPTLRLPHRKAVSKPTTKEQRSSHRIQMLKDKDKLGSCTGTAIGPHAILTAEHCVEGEPTDLRIDLATEKHEIIAASFDDRDHVILILGGSPFTAFEEPVLTKAVIGETVTIYGAAGGTYPPTPRYGKVLDCDDPSDLDAAAEEACYSFEAIPGDSGSAVYNTKGQVVGIVTYRVEDSDTGEVTGIGFSLHYSQKILDRAYTFDGTKQ